MKILIAIPCLTGAVHVKEAIDSVINKEDVNVLLCDNGAEQDVKDVINSYARVKGVMATSNDVNVFVNPAWNQFIKHFLLNEEYSHICIMNSDLILNCDWDIVLKNRWEKDPDEVLIPVMHDDKMKMFESVNTSVMEAKRVYEGTAGVFITLSRKQAEIIFPIPNYVKIWFGDLYVYSILRRLNYQTVIPENFLSHHYWSQTVQKLHGISEMIEEDKRQWELYGESDIQKVVSMHS